MITITVEKSTWHLFFKALSFMCVWLLLLSFLPFNLQWCWLMMMMADGRKTKYTVSNFDAMQIFYCYGTPEGSCSFYLFAFSCPQKTQKFSPLILFFFFPKKAMQKKYLKCERFLLPRKWKRSKKYGCKSFLFWNFRRLFFQKLLFFVWLLSCFNKQTP